jgi:hypothetical protein
MHPRGRRSAVSGERAQKAGKPAGFFAGVTENAIRCAKQGLIWIEMINSNHRAFRLDTLAGQRIRS